MESQSSAWDSLVSELQMRAEEPDGTIGKYLMPCSKTSAGCADTPLESISFRLSKTRLLHLGFGCRYIEKILILQIQILLDPGGDV